MNTELKERIELHKKILDEKSEKKYVFIKYIITIASGLLAVLATLKKGESPNSDIHNIFSTTILGLASAIVFGCIVLYEEVFILKKASKSLFRNIKQSIENNSVENMLIKIDTNFFFKFCNILFFISFIISILGLAFYALHLDIKR